MKAVIEKYGHQWMPSLIATKDHEHDEIWVDQTMVDDEYVARNLASCMMQCYRAGIEYERLRLIKSLKNKDEDYGGIVKVEELGR